MRLIDADKLRKEIHMSYSDDLGIREVINEQPTAYDVDKVVEQLEEKTEIAYNRYMDCSPNTPPSVYARYGTQYNERKLCLKIVKSGGIE